LSALARACSGQSRLTVGCIMDQVFSVSEACAIAHMGRTSFYEALKSGALTARKRGSRTWVLGSELQRFIDALPQIEVKHPVDRRAVSGAPSPKGADNHEGEMPSAAKRRGAA
jgi:hypothetical protein